MSELTEDEVALYDRQIRLWGVEAQSKFDINFLSFSQYSLSNFQHITTNSLIYSKKLIYHSNLTQISSKNRIRNSKVLVYNIRGIGVEVSKNIVLSGVGNIHILDPHSISLSDLSANFFLTPDDLGKSVFIFFHYLYYLYY